MQRALVIAVTMAGCAVGVWHLWLAAEAIFIFKTGEPWTSWVAIICGPVSTLPAVVLSLFNRRAAGGWLVMGSLLSFAAFLMGEGGLTDNLLPYVWMMAAPMFFIGIIMLVLAKSVISNP
jgi:hypothetical protein